jgi:hypothetical protein
VNINPFSKNNDIIATTYALIKNDSIITVVNVAFARKAKHLQQIQNQNPYEPTGISFGNCMSIIKS